MDYDHVWMNSARNLSPTFGNKLPHAPSFCPEPYPRRNGMFVNTPSRHTAKCSRFRNCLSEPRLSCVVNQNVRCHPYQPLVTSFQETDCRRPKTYHGGTCGPETEEKFSCCRQKMPSNTGKGNCNRIIYHSKSNVRQKPPKTKIKGNFSALNTENNRQENYAVNAIENNRQANYAVSVIDNNRYPNYAVSAIDNNWQANYAVSATDNNWQANYAVNAIENNRHANYAVNAIANNRQANYAVNATDNNRQANYAVNAITNNRQASYAINAIDNNRQENSTINATIDYVPNKEVLVKIKGENSRRSELPITNEQSYANGKDCSYEDIIKANNIKSSLSYANEIQNMNLIAKNIGFNPEYQNEALLNNVTNAIEGNKDLVFTDSMTNADISSLQAMNNPAISGYQIAHITIPEDINSNTQDIQHEISEYTDIESSFFKPIFEGKDENGDNIVFLLNSGMQQMVNDMNTDTFVYNENLNTGIKQDNALNSTGDNTITDQTSKEFHFDTQQMKHDDVFNSTGGNMVSDQTSTEFYFDTQQIKQDDALNSTGDNMATDQNSTEFYFDTQQIKQDGALNSTGDNMVTDQTSTEFHFDKQQIKQKHNDHSQDIFFSHIDDHASEEIVITSKAPKSKKKKKKNDINADRNQETTVKQAAAENNATSSCVSELSSSREIEEISTNTAQNVNSSGKKLNFRTRNKQWKANEPLRNIQREYSGKILKRVKMENKHLMADERFWNMYRIMVSRIGDNVMGTMYNMLPALVHNYEAPKQKTNTAASKGDKKRLQVKLPTKPKKRKNSDN